MRVITAAVLASVAATALSSPPRTGSRVGPPTGPLTCTAVIGLITTGEGYNAGFEEGLCAGRATNGRAFSHYGA